MEVRFVFDSDDLLYYHLHKISLKRGESYRDSPKWLKNKRATINPKNHQSLKKDPKKISKIKPFIDQYEWKNINFLATIIYWKKFEQDNKTIALNILFVP